MGAMWDEQTTRRMAKTRLSKVIHRIELIPRTLVTLGADSGDATLGYPTDSGDEANS